MSAKLIISVSGLRGIVGQSLTPQVASNYVAAFASVLEPGPIVVARDGRSSGPVLKDCITAGLRACGRDCLDTEVAATPTVGVLVKQLGAAGAVQISASHNPPPYNGIKLFGPDGRVLDAATGVKIKQAYLDGVAPWVGFDKLGQVTQVDQPHHSHLQAVLKTVDVDAISKATFSVLIDSNHGAGSLLGQQLLSALKCQITLLGATPDGQFDHVPEPTAENLKGVCQQVIDSGAAVGFCQDPDADRLALIDEQGRYIGEEYTLALCVQRALLEPETKGTIVINGATSGMSERLAAAAGVKALRSPVGEANVADQMIASQATYGGEGNGGPIDPRVGYVRDSFVGMAQVLDLMVRTGKPLSQLADELPRLEICKQQATLDSDGLPDLLNRLEDAFPDAEVDRRDGLRLAWSDRWLLVRGSNTEPIVRFIAEAESQALAAELCQQAQQLAQA
ncbi:MAG: phosphoglucosamine mutase [Rhodopirellula sp. TMED11]|nr:MAG: phosphoglucosamine mutase [Rhodopirellula sp. TMED11]